MSDSFSSNPAKAQKAGRLEMFQSFSIIIYLFIFHFIMIFNLDEYRKIFTISYFCIHFVIHLFFPFFHIVFVSYRVWMCGKILCKYLSKIIKPPLHFHINSGNKMPFSSFLSCISYLHQIQSLLFSLF